MYFNEIGYNVIINITLPHEYSGTINYSVSGSASSGSDFVALPGSVTVNGDSLQITVDLNDDVDFENIETIELYIKNNY